MLLYELEKRGDIKTHMVSQLGNNAQRFIAFKHTIDKVIMLSLARYVYTHKSWLYSTFI